MEVVDFAHYSRRRSVQAALVAPDGTAALRVQTDRWAMLHTEAEQPDGSADEFWSDLQLRMAYPTLHFRHH